MHDDILFPVVFFFLNTTPVANFIPKLTHLAMLSCSSLHLSSRFLSTIPIWPGRAGDMNSSSLAGLAFLDETASSYLFPYHPPLTQLFKLVIIFMSSRDSKRLFRTRHRQCLNAMECHIFFFFFFLVKRAWCFWSANQDTWIHTGVPPQLACFPQDPITIKTIAALLRSQD